jgi:predicted HicB family RNase H-like nuclease
MTKKASELRVRTTPEIKRAIAVLAAQDGRSINSYVNKVLEKEVTARKRKAA